jgi:RNA methyltransferase, TrmH family
MLSKAFEKYINSLKTKKGRREHKRYLMEGEKSVRELIASGLPYERIVITEQGLGDGFAGSIDTKKLDVCEPQEMKRISALQTPSQVLAVVDIPTYERPASLSGLSLALDGLQDPGNLGTIIRTADWFGIECAFLSVDTVDAYNPKTVQSAMGSILRVKTVELPLDELFAHYNEVPVYAADTNGRDIRDVHVTTPAILLIGNEGNGIKSQWSPFVKDAVSIPRFGHAESLNASVATAILCAWFTMQLKV